MPRAGFKPAFGLGFRRFDEGLEVTKIAKK